MLNVSNLRLSGRMAVLGLGAVLVACSPSDGSGTAQQSAGAEAQAPDLPIVDPDMEAELVVWRDLMPTEELEAMAALNEGTADPGLMSRFVGNSPISNQAGTFNVVEDLDGLVARMPGYILPLDFAEQGSAREFLLLPFHGACVHYPPPPPNQIVYLRSAEPVEFGSLWEPVWVEGLMTVERVDTDLAASAYSMVVRSVEPYQP